MKRVVVLLALALSALTASAKNLYIPAAGIAPGANGTFFRTDVRIFNPSTTKTIGVSVHFLPLGIDGSNISGRIVFVEPRKMAVLNDIVGTFLQVPAPAIGAIRLDSDEDVSYEFSADSRTYTDSPNPAVAGTYGQFVPALEASAAQRKTVVLHVSSSSAFRANVGLMNPYGYVEASATLSLHRADGTLIAEAPALSVLGHSMVQRSIASVFGSVPDFEDGYITVDSTQPIFAYASVVDNRSGDQTFHLGAKDDATVRPLGD